MNPFTHLGIQASLQTRQKDYLHWQQSTVAMHEVEPVGYFGSALVAVPVVQGGALATSITWCQFPLRTLKDG
jgi:hypothetical protein